MSECPPISDLQTRELAPAIATHLERCTSCRLVVDLVAERDEVAQAREREVECERFENLLAARVDTTLAPDAARDLDEHLASCVNCRVIANGMGTMSDVREVRSGPREDLPTLPEVDPESYALGREVARGGMGRILEARDLRVGRPVAVKELLSTTPTHTARFEREARVTARLQHPGVVPIYEIGTWPDGKPFYTMRMVEGRTLRSALRSATTLVERLALLPSVIAAAEAIAYAHAHRIIHRDLTPSNILIGDYGETVVIDWGLAKDLSRDGDDDALDAGPYRAEGEIEGLTIAGAVVGTAAYMPVEQASGESVDERSDVYALGAILYHLLVGAAPYRADTSVEILDKVKAGAPPPIEAPAAPRDLVSIATKAMARDASDRYANVGDLAAELVRFRNGMIVEAHRYTRRELVWRWIRKHRAAVVGASAALLVLLVAGSVAVAGIVRERDRADGARAVAVAQRAESETQRMKAQSVARDLLEEQGRQEMLHGDPLRALAYLNEAYQQGLDTLALRLLLAEGMRGIENRRHVYDCDDNATSVDVSPDGLFVLAACWTKVRVWHVDGRAAFSLPTDARLARYSHDGKTIVTAGRTVMLWDAATGAHSRDLVGHEKGVVFAAFTPDDREVVTVGADGSARVSTVATGTARLVLHLGAPQNEARGTLSTNGRMLVMASLHGQLEAWDIVSGTHVTARHGSDIADLEISPDGRTIATCGADNTAKLWETASGRLEHTLAAHAKIVFACKFSPDGRRLALASLDGNADVWNVSSGALELVLPHRVYIGEVAFSRDGTRIATWGLGALYLWDARTGARLSNFAASGFFGVATWAADRSSLFVTTKNQVIAFDTRATQQRVAFLAPPGEIALEANLDGTRLLTLRDNTLSLWNTETGTRVPHVGLRSKWTADERNDIAHWSSWFSSDGKRLAASTKPGEAVVLDVATGATIASIAVEGMPEDLGLDLHGMRLLVSSPGKSRLWDVERRAVIQKFDGRTRVGALSDSGRRALAWRDARHAEVWDLDAARVLSTIDLGPGDSSVIGFNFDDTRIAMIEQLGSYGAGKIGMWDAATGRRMVSITGSSASFDPERRLLVLFGSGRVQVWRTVDGMLASSAQIRQVGNDASMNAAPAVSSNGELVMTYADDMTAIADIASSVDCRVLARLDRNHLPARISPQDTYGTTSHWIPGTRAIVVMNGGVSVWSFALEQRSPAEIDRIVKAHVPWLVRDGRIVAGPGGRVQGRVSRRGNPVHATITAKQTGYNTPFETTTAPDGTFELVDLPRDTYTITARDDSTTSRSNRINITPDAPITLDLELP